MRRGLVLLEGPVVVGEHGYGGALGGGAGGAGGVLDGLLGGLGEQVAGQADRERRQDRQPGDQPGRHGAASGAGLAHDLGGGLVGQPLGTGVGRRFRGGGRGLLLGGLLGEGGVVRGPPLGVEQHLGGLVVEPEPAVGRGQVGDRVAPGDPDLVGGRGAVDVEDVVPVGGAHWSAPVIGVKSSTSHSPPVFTSVTWIRNGTGSCGCSSPDLSG